MRWKTDVERSLEELVRIERRTPGRIASRLRAMPAMIAEGRPERAVFLNVVVLRKKES